MLLLSNFVIVFLLLSAIYAGLDKVFPITLFIGILFFSQLLNKLLASITPESNFIKKLVAKFKDKYPAESLAKKSKIALLFLYFAIWIGFVSEIVCLASGHGLSVFDSFNSRLFVAITYVVLLFYSIFAKRTLEISFNSKEAEIETQWYRMLEYLAIYQLVFGVLFIGMSYLSEEACVEYGLFTIIDLSIFAVLAYLFCLLAERIFDTYRILNGLFKGKETAYDTPFFVSLLAANKSFKDSLLKTFELVSGVNFSKSEIAGYILDHIEPVSIIAIAIFWCLSSVVIVLPNEEAIFSRMGKNSGGQSYKPGIHFKLPWPFESVKLYEPGKVQVMNIGFKPDPTKKHIIWAKSHAAENFFLLVGDGVEIISIDCQLFYKVNDLYKYVTKLQNPEAYIESLCYKLITASTVSQNFDSIMSQNRDQLMSELREKLQKELDKADIGVTAVEIVILAIHPPLEVAESYEDVISAQIDKQMLILNSNTESIHKKAMKEAFAKNTISNASAYKYNTIANAKGEASSYESRIIGFNTDPELERFRLKLDSLQKMSKSKSLYIIDKSFMRNNDRIMLNLQN